MANNLFGSLVISNTQPEVQENGDEELRSYMDDDCETCSRCGSREYLNSGKMCNNCSDTWG